MEPRSVGGGRGGWTLVELLVSIGVIGLLAAILLPVAHVARENAARISCVNHLRQLGMAFRLYADQWGGFLPHEDDGEALPPFSCGWTRVLVPIVGNARVMECPRAEPGTCSLKMNSLLEQGDSFFFLLSSAGHPSETVLLFDGRVDNPGLRRLPKGTWESAFGRHRGRSNLLFLDGHVEGHEAGGGGVWAGPGPFRWRP